MLNNINYRILLIILPIIACTAAHFLAYSSEYAENIINVSDKLCCGLFAICVATIVPNANKKWMVIGTALSYSLILYLLQIFVPEYKHSGIITALLAPLICSVFSPERNPKRQSNSIRLNYFMAGCFLLVISVAFVPVITFVRSWIIYLINTSYVNTFYSDNASFIYGMIFQFLQTVGLGSFITELRTIAPQAPSSVSFYATTIVLNCCALPALFTAIAINQDHRHRIFWGVFAVASFFCSLTGTSVSLLLLTLLLRYPFLYAFYILMGIAFYFIGQYIDFSISVVPQEFYNPDLNLIKVSLMHPKFLLFATFTFIVSLNFSNLVIVQNKSDSEYKTRSLPIVNSIKIDFNMDTATDDFSFQGFQYIKALGGFNNITLCREQKDHLLFNIINEHLINRDLLEKQCTAKFYTDHSGTIADLTIAEHSSAIYKAIIAYARRLFLDLTTEYKDIPPFDLKKSAFKDQFVASSKLPPRPRATRTPVKNKGLDHALDSDKS